jgi:hypothetical protein
LAVPVIPTAFSIAVFVVLCLLLIHKEIQRALGRAEPSRWRFFLNTLIGSLLVIYGAILLSRFFNLLR